jgi:3-oxoadipate enol-lactonase
LSFKKEFFVAELQPGAGFLHVQGAPLYYEVAGQGYPLLLIHAGIADNSMWDEQFHVFAERYKVMRYDLRGYGKSEFPAGLFANHEDAAALLTFLNVKKAHIIGISFGSQIALDFTLIHPEMVASLVMVAPAAGGHKPSADVIRFNEEEEALLERGDLEGATELNLRMWVDGPKRTPEQVNPSVRRRVHAMQYHAFTVPIPEAAEELELQPPAITRLQEVSVPMLIMVGDYDIPDKLALAQKLAGEIPGAQQVVIPGVAHMVTMEKPGEFNRVVLDFLNRQ